VIQPLPYPEADEIVQIFVAESGGRQRDNWSGANFLDFRALSSVYQAMAGYRSLQFSVSEGDFPVNVRGASVTPSFFQVFGVPPLLGRTLSPDADPPGGGRVVVLGNSLWSSRFEADTGIIGRSLELNGESYTVVGVMPANFEFPSRTQLWSASKFRVPEPPVPLGDDPAENRGGGYLSVVARLKPDLPLGRAAQEARTIAGRLEHDYPENNRGESVAVVPLHDVVVDSVRPALLALFGAVGLVLLIACANVANLLLARATGRAHEIAIRTALGAGRWRLARQLLTESAVLGALGGLGGVGIAYAATGAVVALVGTDLPRVGEISVSLAVLGFALAVSLLSGLLFGFFPALLLTSADPAGALRSAGGRGLAGGSHGRLRSVLVVAEMAVCLSLLVGAGLLARTLAMLNAQDPGFSERGTLTARVNLPGARIPEEGEIRSFQARVLERVRALPGVTTAGAVLSLPIDPGVRGNLTFNIEGRTPEHADEQVSGYQTASDGYFETMGIPVLHGRSFTAADDAEAARVTVVSQAFAERFFPGEAAVGKRIGWGDPEDPDFTWSSVVGVVGNIRLDGLDAEPRVEAYQPMAQAPWPFMTVVLRSSVPPETLSEPLRRAVVEVSPTQPVERIQTMEQILRDSLARRRFTMLLLWTFAGIALTMAAVGLYGVISFSVAQRSREFGIRMAVGASSGRIYSLVMNEAGRLLVAGLVVGAVATAILGRLISSFLYQVRPTDPAAFAAAIAVLAAASLVAAWVPARRATRTDPMAALRIE
jgi:predicted permease